MPIATSRVPRAHLALAAVCGLSAVAALGVDLARACVACGHAGDAATAIAALGVAGYAALIAVGWSGRWRVFAAGALAAAAVHAALIAWMAREAAWCAPCCVAAAASAALAFATLRARVLPTRGVGAIAVLAVAFAAAGVALARRADIARSAALAEAAPPSPAARLRVTVYERAGCPACRDFRGGDAERLRREFGDAVDLAFVPAAGARGVRITPTVVVGARVFEGAPPYDDLRASVAEAIAHPRSAAPPPVAAAAATGATYYIAADGSDAYTPAQARSRATPWAHLPGMPTCAGQCATYVPQPGDAFVLRGGDAWHARDLGVDWEWSGTADARITIGVDPTWFSGAAWSRPVFDCESAPCAGPTRQQIWIDGAYVTVDDLELTGLRQVGGSVQDIAVYRDHVEVSRCYVHGWSHAPGETDNGVTAAISTDWSLGEERVAGSSFHDNVIDGSDTTRDAWNGILFADQVYDNVIRYVVSGMLGDFSDVHGNLIEDDVYSYGGDHANLLFVFGPFDGAPGVRAYGNVVRHNRAAPGSMAFWINGDSGCVGCTSWISDNVIYDADNGVMALGSHPQSGDTGTYYVSGNTIEADGGACMGNGEGPPRSTTHAANNHCINATRLCDATGTTAIDDGGNLLMSSSAAAAAGYAADDDAAFAPVSASAPTVGAGLDESASCAAHPELCSAIAYPTYDSVAHRVVMRAATARPTSGAWDVGAYQFASAGGTTGGSTSGTTTGGTASGTTTGGTTSGGTTTSGGVGGDGPRHHGCGAGGLGGALAIGCGLALARRRR